jgi:hypothetical protein
VGTKEQKLSVWRRLLPWMWPESLPCSLLSHWLAPWEGCGAGLHTEQKPWSIEVWQIDEPLELNDNVENPSPPPQMGHSTPFSTPEKSLLIWWVSLIEGFIHTCVHSLVLLTCIEKCPTSSSPMPGTF